MIRCSEATELVSLYIDKKLDASRERDFEEHIKICGSCRKELEDMEKLVEACRNMPEIPLPEDFRTKLHEKLAQYYEEKQRKKKSILARNRYIKICGTVAACLVLVLLVKGFTGDSFLNVHKTASDRGMEIKQESAGQAPDMLMARELVPEDENGYADAASDAGEFDALWSSEGLASKEGMKTYAFMERPQQNEAAAGGSSAYSEPQRNGYCVERKMAGRKITINCGNDPDLLKSRFDIVKRIAADSGANILEASEDETSLVINLPVSGYTTFLSRLCQAVNEKSVEINITDISKPDTDEDTLESNSNSDSAVLIQIEFICSE